MSDQTPTFVPGQRVTVTQQVQHKGWTASVTGVIEAIEQRKTGSWFAHAKDDKLWLDRLVLKKDDGEIVVCNLDAYSRIEAAAEPEASCSSPADEASPQAAEAPGTVSGDTASGGASGGDGTASEAAGSKDATTTSASASASTSGAGGGSD